MPAEIQSEVFIWMRKMDEIACTAVTAALPCVLREVCEMFGENTMFPFNNMSNGSYCKNFLGNCRDIPFDASGRSYTLANFQDSSFIETWLKKLRSYFEIRFGLDADTFLNGGDDTIAQIFYCHEVATMLKQDDSSPKLVFRSSGDCQERLRILTMFSCVSASGYVLKPLLTVKNRTAERKYLSKPKTCNSSEIWSKEGTMECDVLLDWLHLIVDELEAKVVGRPLVIFLDQSLQHTSLAALDYCQIHMIILFYIPLPPTVKNFFGLNLFIKLNRTYVEIVNSKVRKSFSKSALGQLLSDVWNSAIAASDVREEFGAMGIVPLSEEKLMLAVQSKQAVRQSHVKDEHAVRITPVTEISPKDSTPSPGSYSIDAACSAGTATGKPCTTVSFDSVTHTTAVGGLCVTAAGDSETVSFHGFRDIPSSINVPASDALRPAPRVPPNASDVLPPASDAHRPASDAPVVLVGVASVGSHADEGPTQKRSPQPCGCEVSKSSTRSVGHGRKRARTSGRGSATVKQKVVRARSSTGVFVSSHGSIGKPEERKLMVNPLPNLTAEFMKYENKKMKMIRDDERILTCTQTCSSPSNPSPRRKYIRRKRSCSSSGKSRFSENVSETLNDGTSVKLDCLRKSPNKYLKKDSVEPAGITSAAMPRDCEGNPSSVPSLRTSFESQAPSGTTVAVFFDEATKTKKILTTRRPLASKTKARKSRLSAGQCRGTSRSPLARGSSSSSSAKAEATEPRCQLPYGTSQTDPSDQSPSRSDVQSCRNCHVMLDRGRINGIKEGVNMALIKVEASIPDDMLLVYKQRFVKLRQEGDDSYFDSSKCHSRNLYVQKDPAFMMWLELKRCREMNTGELKLLKPLDSFEKILNIQNKESIVERRLDLIGGKESEFDVDSDFRMEETNMKSFLNRVHEGTDKESSRTVLWRKTFLEKLDAVSNTDLLRVKSQSCASIHKNSTTNVRLSQGESSNKIKIFHMSTHSDDGAVKNSIADAIHNPTQINSDATQLLNRSSSEPTSSVKLESFDAVFGPRRGAHELSSKEGGSCESSLLKCSPAVPADIVDGCLPKQDTKNGLSLLMDVQRGPADYTRSPSCMVAIPVSTSHLLESSRFAGISNTSNLNVTSESGMLLRTYKPLPSLVQGSIPNAVSSMSSTNVMYDHTPKHYESSICHASQPMLVQPQKQFFVKPETGNIDSSFPASFTPMVGTQFANDLYYPRAGLTPNMFCYGNSGVLPLQEEMMSFSSATGPVQYHLNMPRNDPNYATMNTIPSGGYNTGLQFANCRGFQTLSAVPQHMQPLMSTPKHQHSFDLNVKTSAQYVDTSNTCQQVKLPTTGYVSSSLTDTTDSCSTANSAVLVGNDSGVYLGLDRSGVEEFAQADVVHAPQNIFLKPACHFRNQNNFDSTFNCSPSLYYGDGTSNEVAADNQRFVNNPGAVAADCQSASYGSSDLVPSEQLSLAVNSNNSSGNVGADASTTCDGIPYQSTSEVSLPFASTYEAATLISETESFALSYQNEADSNVIQCASRRCLPSSTNVSSLQSLHTDSSFASQPQSTASKSPEATKEDSVRGVTDAQAAHEFALTRTDKSSTEGSDTHLDQSAGPGCDDASTCVSTEQHGGHGNDVSSEMCSNSSNNSDNYCWQNVSEVSDKHESSENETQNRTSESNVVHKIVSSNDGKTDGFSADAFRDMKTHFTDGNSGDTKSGIHDKFNDTQYDSDSHCSKGNDQSAYTEQSFEYTIEDNLPEGRSCDRSSEENLHEGHLCDRSTEELNITEARSCDRSSEELNLHEGHSCDRSSEDLIAYEDDMDESTERLPSPGRDSHAAELPRGRSSRSSDSESSSCCDLQIAEGSTDEGDDVLSS